MADSEQVGASLKLLFQPWKWRTGSATSDLEQALSQRFGGSAFAFSSGREALLAILSSLHLQKDEEVIVQGYTCVVVANAVLAAGMKPVFCDIERDTLNLDLSEVEKAITPKTRAIICQHTFGIPAYAKQLRDICDRHSLVFIEDCAHVIPDDPQSPIGRYGDALFFSFGRDKAISGISGGAAVCKLKEVCVHLEQLQKDATYPGLMRIKRYLFYPLVYALARPFYGIGVGKALLVLAAKLGALVPIVTNREKRGHMRPVLHRMPNACAALVLLQWKKLKAINDHRRQLTRLYFDEGTKRGWPLLLGITPDLPLQKFPLFVKGAEKIRMNLKKKNIHLHDGWTGCVICPAASDCEAVGYRDGDDPAAEMAGEQILSLPTHPNMSLRQAQKLIDTLDPLLP